LPENALDTAVEVKLFSLTESKMYKALGTCYKAVTEYIITIPLVQSRKPLCSEREKNIHMYSVEYIRTLILNAINVLTITSV
jgi:hypothetical protein